MFICELMATFSNIGVALTVSGLLVLAFNEPKIAEATKLLMSGIIIIITSLIVKVVIKEDIR